MGIVLQKLKHWANYWVHSNIEGPAFHGRITDIRCLKYAFLYITYTYKYTYTYNGKTTNNLTLLQGRTSNLTCHFVHCTRSWSRGAGSVSSLSYLAIKSVAADGDTPSPNPTCTYEHSHFTIDTKSAYHQNLEHSRHLILYSSIVLKYWNFQKLGNIYMFYMLLNSASSWTTSERVHWTGNQFQGAESSSLE